MKRPRTTILTYGMRGVTLTLFPGVKMIVQHGGAATIAAALSSGKPNVICPSTPEDDAISCGD